MNYRLWSARAAICFAPLVVAQVVARNWGGWEAWPYWLDDIVAAVLLIVSGYLVLDTDTTTNSRGLTGAWGFTVATQWVSMFRLLEQSPINDPTPVWLISLTLISVLSSIICAVASLPSKRAVGGAGPAKPAVSPAARPRPKAKSRSRTKSS